MSQEHSAESIIELITASDYLHIINEDDSGLKELLGSDYDYD